MKKTKNKPLLGFIGQGYIGKNYSNDFEKRGYEVVRYALEPAYEHNKERIADCDIVFIAVPTPTTPLGFSDKIIRNVIKLVGKGKIAVIKSTILPGTVKSIQKENKNIIVLNSPEFLSEATASRDASRPFSNIVGIPINSPKYKKSAEMVHGVLPKAPYNLTCDSTEAEIIKYTHNGSGFVQIIFFNMMYDLARKMGSNWDVIQEAIEADPLVPSRYAKPVHQKGRGAGGHCFIKDFSALTDFYGKKVKDNLGDKVFESLSKKNISLLLKTKKDIDLLKGVYGKDVKI